ncbi:MAG: hypothetical protein Q4E17_00040 [Synergistes sp.]|nr:hypothetical protein [Synergistes sp.]
MFRKLLLSALSVCLVIFVTFGTAFAFTLPEIKGWNNGAVKEARLDGVNGDHGMWIERTYRSPDGLMFNGVLVSGDGAKLWNIDSSVSGDIVEYDGYSAKRLTVSGRKAVIEVRPVRGASLIVALDKNNLLTLESPFADTDKLVRAADVLIKAMENNIAPPAKS